MHWFQAQTCVAHFYLLRCAHKDHFLLCHNNVLISPAHKFKFCSLYVVSHVAFQWFAFYITADFSISYFDKRAEY